MTTLLHVSGSERQRSWPPSHLNCGRRRPWVTSTPSPFPIKKFGSIPLLHRNSSTAQAKMGRGHGPLPSFFLGERWRSNDHAPPIRRRRSGEVMATFPLPPGSDMQVAMTTSPLFSRDERRTSWPPSYRSFRRGRPWVVGTPFPSKSKDQGALLHSPVTLPISKQERVEVIAS